MQIICFGIGRSLKDNNAQHPSSTPQPPAKLTLEREIYKNSEVEVKKSAIKIGKDGLN